MPSKILSRNHPGILFMEENISAVPEKGIDLNAQTRYFS
jgi:hypothetical protein